MKFYEALGDVLKEHRTEQERSLSWVAKKSNISISGYRVIEQGQSKAPMDKIERICDAFGVTLQSVLSDVLKRM